MTGDYSAISMMLRQRAMILLKILKGEVSKGYFCGSIFVTENGGNTKVQKIQCSNQRIYGNYMFSITTK